MPTTRTFAAAGSWIWCLAKSRAGLRSTVCLSHQRKRENANAQVEEAKAGRPHSTWARSRGRTQDVFGFPARVLRGFEHTPSSNSADWRTTSGDRGLLLRPQRSIQSMWEMCGERTPPRGCRKTGRLWRQKAAESGACVLISDGGAAKVSYRSVAVSELNGRQFGIPRP